MSDLAKLQDVLNNQEEDGVNSLSWPRLDHVYYRGQWWS